MLLNNTKTLFLRAIKTITLVYMLNLLSACLPETYFTITNPINGANYVGIATKMPNVEASLNAFPDQIVIEYQSYNAPESLDVYLNNLSITEFIDYGETQATIETVDIVDYLRAGENLLKVDPVAFGPSSVFYLDMDGPNIVQKFVCYGSEDTNPDPDVFEPCPAGGAADNQNVLVKLAAEDASSVVSVTINGVTATKVNGLFEATIAAADVYTIDAEDEHGYTSSVQYLSNGVSVPEIFKARVGNDAFETLLPTANTLVSGTKITQEQLDTFLGESVLPAGQSDGLDRKLWIKLHQISLGDVKVEEMVLEKPLQEGEEGYDPKWTGRMRIEAEVTPPASVDWAFEDYKINQHQMGAADTGSDAIDSLVNVFTNSLGRISEAAALDIIGTEGGPGDEDDVEGAGTGLYIALDLILSAIRRCNLLLPGAGDSAVGPNACGDFGGYSSTPIVDPLNPPDQGYVAASYVGRDMALFIESLQFSTYVNFRLNNGALEIDMDGLQLSFGDVAGAKGDANLMTTIVAMFNSQGILMGIVSNIVEAAFEENLDSFNLGAEISSERGQSLNVSSLALDAIANDEEVVLTYRSGMDVTSPHPAVNSILGSVYVPDPLPNFLSEDSNFDLSLSSNVINQSLASFYSIGMTHITIFDDNDNQNTFNDDIIETLKGFDKEGENEELIDFLNNIHFTPGAIDDSFGPDNGPALINFTDFLPDNLKLELAPSGPGQFMFSEGIDNQANVAFYDTKLMVSTKQEGLWVTQIELLVDLQIGLLIEVDNNVVSVRLNGTPALDIKSLINKTIFPVNTLLVDLVIDKVLLDVLPLIADVYLELEISEIEDPDGRFKFDINIDEFSTNDGHMGLGITVGPSVDED